jgi:hypothetical protein
MSFKDFITSTLTDERGSISHKRIIVSLGALSLFVAFLAHMPIDIELAKIIAGIVAVGMGFTTWDKFSNKPNKDE